MVFKILFTKDVLILFLLYKKWFLFDFIRKKFIKKGFTIYLKELFQFYKKVFGLFIYLRDVVSNFYLENGFKFIKKQTQFQILRKMIPYLFF